jgi:hypothetical protein
MKKVRILVLACLMTLFAGCIGDMKFVKADLTVDKIEYQAYTNNSIIVAITDVKEQITDDKKVVIVKLALDNEFFEAMKITGDKTVLIDGDDKEYKYDKAETASAGLLYGGIFKTSSLEPSKTYVGSIAYVIPKDSNIDDYKIKIEGGMELPIEVIKK